MKTCLYCGGNNNDSAQNCVICGKDMQTGKRTPKKLRTASLGDHAATWALPRPESPFAGLVLIVPALVLFLLGLAVVFGPTVEWFYDLKLPKMANPGGLSGFLILSAIALVCVMLVRLINLATARKGYYLILSETADEENTYINRYQKYREHAGKLYSLLWLVPILGFCVLIGVFYMGSIALAFIVAGVEIALPDVEDALPYVLLLVAGLTFLVVQFTLSLRTTVSFRRYEKALRGEHVRGMEETRSGLTAALDARWYPHPETASVYFLLIPAIVVLILLGLAIELAPSLGDVMGIHLPLFAHPNGFGILFQMCAAVLTVAMIVCYKKQKTVNDGYYEALEMDEETPFSVKLEKYAHYQKKVCDYYCFLWLLPVALFLAIMQLLYVSSYARFAVFFGRYRLNLPQVREPIPYVLLCLLAVVFLVVLFFSTLSKTRTFRRADVANRKRRREEAERMAAEAAAAEAAAAEVSSTESEEDGGLLGYYAGATGESASAEKTAPADDFSFFLNDDGTAYEPKASQSDSRRPDYLDRLCSIDAQGTIESTPTRSMSSFKQLCEWFTDFARAKGFEPEEASVRALMAAMSASRVVFVRPLGEAAEAFSATLAKFFGTNSPVADVTDTWGNAGSVLFDGFCDSKRASDSLCAVYQAAYAKDAFCTLTFTNAQQGSVKNYLTDMLAYSESPNHTHSLRLSDESVANLPARARFVSETETEDGGVYVSMPANVWCLAVSSDANGFCAPAVSCRTGAALTVSLRGKACEPAADQSVSEEGISVAAFDRLTRGITERQFLPEEQWKKFDRVENYLYNRAGIRFDNRMMRCLENFSSAYLTVADDVNVILDAMLEAVLLPWIAELDANLLQPDDGSVGIREAMALAFGADNIPHSMQALHELGCDA